MLYESKTLPDFYQAIEDETKKFEIREDDRPYKVGDYLHLKEWDPEIGFTGRQTIRLVTYILAEQPFVPEGYVCMSIDHL